VQNALLPVKEFVMTTEDIYSEETPEEEIEEVTSEEIVEEQEEEPVKEQEVQQETSEGVPEETPGEGAEELVVQEEDILQVGDIVIEDIMDEQNEIEIEPEDETQPKKPATWWKVVLKILGWLLLAAVVAVAAYVAVGHFFPDWIDQFLYTPEELEILNYR
jgi:hypothetical protein